MNHSERDLGEILRELDRQADDEAARIAEERAALDQRIRQLDERLEQARASRDRLDAEGPRAARRVAQQRTLAVRDSLLRDLERLADGAKGAWGAPVALPAAIADGRLTVVMPAPAEAASDWSAFRETATFRIALVAYGFLVRAGREYDVEGSPTAGAWSGFLTWTLPIGDASDLAGDDGTLLLEEATPERWAGGGADARPRLVWLDADTLTQEGPKVPERSHAKRSLAPGDDRLTIEEIAHRLSLDPFEVLRHTIEKRQDAPGFALAAELMPTLLGWAGIEDWSDDEAADADTEDDSPRTDPHPRRRVARWIPFKLLQKGKVGASHTRIDNAWRGLSGDLRGFGKDVVDLLKREGLLLSKPTVNGEHIFLDPTRLDTVESIIRWRDPPPSFRTLVGDE